jgi:hypothetical protein
LALELPFIDKTMRRLIIILLLSIHTVFAFGQKTDSSDIGPIQLATIAQENSGNSYITAPADIGNIEPLWFEANLIPNFNIRVSKDSRLMGVLTPQVIIRMYQQESFPVRTPSYMPQLTIYYSLNSKPSAKNFSLFGKLAHHSNGQEDPFYNTDGSINTKSGNFSTNYFELGIVRTRFNKQFNAVQFFSSSFEMHPKSLTIDELDGIYGHYRWNNVISFFKLPREYKSNKKANFSIKGEFSWSFDDMYNWNSCDLKRLNLKLTFFYHPKFLEDIGIFAQIYSGMDYYNIYFDHQISVIRFGIMTEKLRF